MEHAISKRMWHIIQAVYYILRRGLTKKKLMMDLQLLLKRGKLAGKSLTHLLTLHPNASNYSNSSYALPLGLNHSLPNAKEVEFSCSNTPDKSYPSFHIPKRSKRNHMFNSVGEFDAEAVAKAFEILNSQPTDADVAEALRTPSPMLVSGYGLGKSPTIVRQLRVTDSPFPIQEAGQGDAFVDKHADDFIERFYNQLRLQQSVAATPTPERNNNSRHGRRGILN